VNTGGPQRVSIPPQLVGKIRATTRLVGLCTLVLSVLIGILVISLGYSLPTSYNPTTLVMVGMGVLSAAFLFASAVIMLGGRTYVKTGELNTTAAGKARRAMFVLWGGTLLSGVISSWVLSKAVSSSGGFSGRPQLDFSPAIVAYLLLLLSPFVLAGINYLVGRRLLRPSAALVSKYGQATH
jgi:hypothetical protein